MPGAALKPHKRPHTNTYPTHPQTPLHAGRVGCRGACILCSLCPHRTHTNTYPTNPQTPCCRRGGVDAEELAFFANWQLQAAAAVHHHIADADRRRWLAGYLRELQEDVIGTGFFKHVAAVRVHGAYWVTRLNRLSLPPLLTGWYPLGFLACCHAATCACRRRTSRRQWRWHVLWRAWCMRCEPAWPRRRQTRRLAGRRAAAARQRLRGSSAMSCMQSAPGQLSTSCWRRRWAGVCCCCCLPASLHHARLQRSCVGHATLLQLHTQRSPLLRTACALSGCRWAGRGTRGGGRLWAHPTPRVRAAGGRHG